MAILFNATTDGTTAAVSGLTGGTYTLLGWVYLAVDLDTYSGIASLEGTTPSCSLSTRVNGTTLTAWDTAGTEPGLAGTTVTVGTWYRFAVTVGSGTTALYSGTTTGALAKVSAAQAQDSSPTRIAFAKSVFGDYFNGRLHAIKVWNATLSDDEVAVELSQNRPMRSAGLVAWYPAIDDLKDYSGNGRDMVAGSTAVTVEDGPSLRWDARIGVRVASYTSGPADISGAATAPLGGLTATATGTAWRYVDTLTDNFDDNSINSTKWPATFGTGTIAETGAKMTVAPPVDGTLTGIFSAATYRFAGRTVAAQIVPAALNGSAWAWAGITCYHQDYNSYARVYVQRDAGTPETFTMGLVLKDAGTVTRNTFVTSALADMAWVRLRESGGTTYAEASPTGEPNSWVVADSFTTPAPVLASTQIEVDLEAQRATGASSATGPATWDNFNLAPTFNSITGSAAAPLGALTASAAGTRQLSASAAAALGGLAAAATAAVAHPASAAAPLGWLAATASGAVQHAATASGSLGGLAASASGTPATSAVALASLGGLNATASAGVAVGASAAADLGALTAEAEGTVTPGGDINYATDSVYQGPTEVTVDLIAGQLLLLHNAWDWGSHTDMVAPTGGAVSWTEVTADTNTTNAPMHRVWTGVAAADGEVAITCAASTADSWNHLHLRWYPPGWAVVDAASAVGSGTADVDAPSLADGETADVLVASALKGYQGGGIDFDPPDSMVAIETDPTGEYSTLATATETLTGDGATGVREFLAPFSLVEWTSSSVLLREGGTEPVVGAASAPLGALIAAADATRQTAGSAAAVLGGLSATVTGGIAHTATASATLGGLTAAATATTAHPASAAAPLGALAATAAAVVAVGASASATLGSLSAAATATVGHPASAAAALGALTATGSAGVTVLASAAAQLGGLTATATGATGRNAVAAASLGALTATAAAQTSVGATSSAPLGGLVANAAGQPTHPGTAVALLGGLTATAAAGHSVTATAAAPLGSLTATADGVATGEGSGSASAPLGPLTSTAAASRSTVASAQAALGALVATATARRDVTATAAAPLGGLAAAAVGAGGSLGAAHAPLGPLAATASATRGLPGSAVADLGQLDAAANAQAGTIAAAYADLHGLDATAAAGIAVHAAAAANLGPLTAGATADTGHSGSATASLGGLTGVALAIRVVIGAAHADLGALVASAVAGPARTWTPPLHAGPPVRGGHRLHAGRPRSTSALLHAGTPTRD